MNNFVDLSRNLENIEFSKTSFKKTCKDYVKKSEYFSINFKNVKTWTILEKYILYISGVKNEKIIWKIWSGNVDYYEKTSIINNERHFYLFSNVFSLSSFKIPRIVNSHPLLNYSQWQVACQLSRHFQQDFSGRWALCKWLTPIAIPSNPSFFSRNLWRYLGFPHLIISRTQYYPVMYSCLMWSV